MRLRVSGVGEVCHTERDIKSGGCGVVRILDIVVIWIARPAEVEILIHNRSRWEVQPRTPASMERHGQLTCDVYFDGNI